MKSVSVKDLDSLKKEGWRISSADMNVISGQISSQKMSAASAAAVVSVLESINKTIESMEMPEINLKPLLDAHLQQLIAAVGSHQKITKWTFDIKRNNNGFISEVTANAK